MAGFLNLVDLFHMVIWERACVKHLKRRAGRDLRLEGDWTNLLPVTFKMDQPEFFNTSRASR